MLKQIINISSCQYNQLQLFVLNNNLIFKMDPKIIKVNKGLPDVFIQQRNAPKDRKHGQKPEKIVSQKEKTEIGDKIVHHNRQNQQKTQKANKKKNRNPFLNVRQYLRLSKEMDERMKQVRKQLQLDRFSQLNFQNNPDVVPNLSANKEQSKDSKLKYQDCITLSVMKSNNGTCLRKIIHVPTLTLYFLRQSTIDFSIDKNELEQWINKSNSSVNSGWIKPQKIIQSYWNVPQGRFSLIYQYTDGVMFDLILQNINIFPMSFIQNLALTHLKSNLEIFNSILVIKRNQPSQISYLSVYQEIDDMIPQYRSFRELMKIDNDLNQHTNIKNVQKMMTAKLGFLILVSFFSDAIIQQDIANILFQSKDCCLFHKQLNDNNSLIKIYFQNNILSSMQKQIISDFFCKILKFQPEQRASFSELSKHKFFKTKFTGEICCMEEVIQMLQSTGSSVSRSATRQLCLQKLNNLMSSMSSILQGCSENQKRKINLNTSNENIKFLLNEIGLNNSESQRKIYTNQLINKLKKLYDQ